jgi:class III poly(R)-hydroxyalkanoic acid synthase PhaE subunit
VFEQVLQELKDRAENDKPIESIRDLARLWIGAADRSFDKIFRSEAYSKAQGQFVSDYMTYRIHEQAVMEEMMRYSYVATRGEVDEAHRNIHQLRREVRSLKKALQQQQAPAPKSPSKSKAEAEAKQG